MTTNSFIDRFFTVAMKIHAYCTDNCISKEVAKLYVYIYVKSSESPDGIEYFNQDCSTEIEAIKTLLCSDPFEALVLEDPVTPQELQNAYKVFVSKSLQKLERDIQLEYGLENVFRGELLNRLRFHTDESFRKKHIDFFLKTILPGIANYTDAKVKLSNINYQIKLAKEEQELNLLLNS